MRKLDQSDHLRLTVKLAGTKKKKKKRSDKTETTDRIHRNTQQLLFIKQCRALDMTIEEIKLVLETRANPENSCENVNTTIDKHVDDIEHRIAELKVLQETLISIRSACDHDKKVKECGVLHQLDSIAEVCSSSTEN
ncbi:MAG: MerR family DNA-binding protein [Paraglaciecola chathamensis]